jgi:hypothetical protein
LGETHNSASKCCRRRAARLPIFVAAVGEAIFALLLYFPSLLRGRKNMYVIGGWRLDGLGLEGA